LSPRLWKTVANHISRLNWPVSRNATNWIAGTNHLPTPNTTSGETDGEALRPVIAATRWIDTRSATEFREIADEGVVQQSTLMQVFDQR
jgi:hypothetical protein